MLNFTYQGRKFVNGYACNALGRPITVKNGYSSEDERNEMGQEISLENGYTDEDVEITRKLASREF